MGKILLIGQAPNKTGDPKLILEGQLGKKIADLCGFSFPEYLQRFDRINILDKWPGRSGKGDAFPKVEAERNAKSIRKNLAQYDRAVLLGQNVARSFGVNVKFLCWFRLDSTKALVLPHPSGINRWYNNPQNLRRALKIMRQLSIQ